MLRRPNQSLNFFAVFTLGALASGGCGGAPPAKAPDGAPAAAKQPAPLDPSAQLAGRAKAALGQLPSPPQSPPELVALGRKLFFEKGVSADGDVGCVTCHDREHFAADGLPKSKGAFGRLNARNAPTVFNAAYQFAEHWRADRESVEDQARRALLGPASFGLDSNETAVKLMRELPYADAFQRVFPQSPAPISVENWGTAIGAYERTLLTPAPIDAFMAGDAHALSSQQQAGLTTFLDLGCARCHSGPLVGGDFTKKFGTVADYAPLTNSNPADAGRFDVTHNEADRFVFKVPSLRNVQKTAPYFHDGSVPELPRAIEIMAATQLGTQLSPQQLEDLVAFLGSLTGTIPDSFAPPDSNRP